MFPFVSTTFEKRLSIVYVFSLGQFFFFFLQRFIRPDMGRTGLLSLPPVKHVVITWSSIRTALLTTTGCCLQELSCLSEDHHPHHKRRRCEWMSNAVEHCVFHEKTVFPHTTWWRILWCFHFKFKSLTSATVFGACVRVFAQEIYAYERAWSCVELCPFALLDRRGSCPQTGRISSFAHNDTYK